MTEPTAYPEPPDGSVVRIIYSTGAASSDYFTREDDAAQGAGDPAGFHWFRVGDDNLDPISWAELVAMAHAADGAPQRLLPEEASR